MHSILKGFAMLIACAGPVMAQGKAIQSPTGRGLAWIETLEGAGVQDPSGSFAAVEIPAGTIVSAFQEFEDGWLAAGQRWTESGSDLVLLRHRAGVIELIEPPAKDSDAFRTAPVPLVERDGQLASAELAGLAWLEGDGGENNAVMASRWTGDSFEPARVVSPWAGEAQLALSGTVLEKGLALLVWAAVDAGDDDIYWSQANLTRSDGWSPPAKLHPDNEVPDLTPQLAAVPGGALVAWSHFDGTLYRLRVARFAGGEWSDTGITSEETASRPTPFPTAGGSAGFFYQTAAPTWVLIEIDASGRLLRRAVEDRVPGETRPLVTSDETGSLGIRFVDRPAPHQEKSGGRAWHRIDWIELP